MTLAVNYAMGDREHVALRMLPCVVPRLHVAESDKRKALLRALHPDGYRDMRAFLKGQKPQTFSFVVGNLKGVDEFATLYHDRDVYVGVAPRMDAKGRDTSACRNLHALFADQDYKDSSEAEARARLAAFPLVPSAVIASGGGLQSYWLLSEPLNLQNAGAAQAKQLLRALATTLGADLSAAEPARILRLPGTRNYKYTPPRDVVVETLDVSRQYSLTEMAAALTTVGPTSDVRAPRGRDDQQNILNRARAYLEKTPPAIEGHGGDTHTFTVLCRVVRGFDLTEDAALDVLSEWNARCVPPWSEADLRDKIAGARKYGTEPVGELAACHLILNPNDPLPSAREFVAREHTVDDALTLRHQSHVFLAYEQDAGAYIEQDEASIRARLYGFLESAKRRSDDNKTVPFQPTRAKVENVLDALRAVTNLPTSVAAPAYLKSDPGFDPLDMLACPNGLLHIPTRTLHLPTPDFFTLNAIDFAYDPWASRPVQWFAFLKSLWPEDDESIETVQELFGYLLTPDTRFQKIFLEVGPPRSGKGIKGRILRRLVGERNTCSPTLAAFGRDFGKHVLIGKTVAIISDARIGGRTDTASVAETLLSISGEDAQTVERKFLPDWNGKLSTRFVLLTNELPRITDVSGALAKRFIVLALQQSFYGKEDLGLYDRLVPELPGILMWALDGRDRLYARGYFQQPKSASELIQEFVDLGSPEATFLRQCTHIEPGATVSQKELFAAWTLWCMENGRDRPGNAQTFGRNVRAAYPWITTRQLGSRGEQERCWEGLRLEQVVVPDLHGM